MTAHSSRSGLLFGLGNKFPQTNKIVKDDLAPRLFFQVYLNSPNMSARIEGIPCRRREMGEVNLSPISGQVCSQRVEKASSFSSSA